MSSELTDRSAVAVREWTRGWLADHLPAGWMQAIDTADGATVTALRAQINYDDWCIQLGSDGLATPTWPSEYGAGLSLTPGEAKPLNDELARYQGKLGHLERLLRAADGPALEKLFTEARAARDQWLKSST